VVVDAPQADGHVALCFVVAKHSGPT
jgi:hypothetical protein